jgi:hypothetical protein
MYLVGLSGLRTFSRGASACTEDRFVLFVRMVFDRREGPYEPMEV